ncbi:cupin domain-containing protein [Sorangium sp. So ce131]|uniref:cupin domain-containing protein n=1 Tax=Sorangium sp. So ce131 TaxID=3133282 RepID=UPI003F609665
MLGRVLELTHLRGRVYCHTSARAPWGLCVDASADAGFHLVTAGTCWLFLGEQRVALGRGDVVLLPRGSAHALADHARSRRIPLAAWLAARGTVDRRMRLGDGEGAETQVLCGGREHARTPDLLLEGVELALLLLHLPGHAGGTRAGRGRERCVFRSACQPFGNTSMFPTVRSCMLARRAPSSVHG